MLLQRLITFDLKVCSAVCLKLTTVIQSQSKEPVNLHVACLQHVEAKKQDFDFMTDLLLNTTSLRVTGLNPFGRVQIRILALIFAGPSVFALSASC